MADQKISDMDAAATLDGTELVESVQSGVNVQTTTQDIADLGGGGGDVATDTIFDTKGDLVAATGADAAVKVPAGTNGHVLTADSAQTAGVKWAAAAGSVAADAIFDAKGDLPVGTAADTAAKLSAGTNGFDLTADSSTSTGLAYRHPPLIRMKRSGVSHIGGLAMGEGTEAAKAVTVNFPLYIPIWIERSIPVDRVTFYVAVASASGVALLGLFSAHATTGIPETRLFDWGTVTTVGTGYKTITIASTIPAGLSYIYLDMDQNFSCSATTAGHSYPLDWIAGAFVPVLYFSENRAYTGNPPATAGTLANQTDVPPVVRLRVT